MYLYAAKTSHEFETWMRSGATELLYREPRKFGRWQAMDVSGSDAHDMRELMNVNLQIDVPDRITELKDMVSPNLPWAEDHFLERVSGEPLNPGEQYKNWPWYKGGVEDHKAKGHFSHSYMERYWPKRANPDNIAQLRGLDHTDVNVGIRYVYGDLMDVVNLLLREPYTRQAYLPVWFPEDTGAVHGGRVPCSIGYHFMMRNGALHCWYYMRSCDFVRYVRDDIYLTSRLIQWVVEQVNARIGADEDTPTFNVGTLHMTIASLHAFRGDEFRLTEMARD